MLVCAAIEQVAPELARLDRPASRDADELHVLLQLLGDLTLEETAARRDPDLLDVTAVEGCLAKLVSSRRVVEIRVAGETRYAAAEDAARFRDALGVSPSAGLPAVLLEPVPDPLGDLVSRFARTHGPFTAARAAMRLGLGEAPVKMTLDRVAEAGRVVAGAFTTGVNAGQWCHATVLRQIKRRSLARLRRQGRGGAYPGTGAFPACLARYRAATSRARRPARRD